MSDVYVYMHKHARLGGSRGMLPQEIFRKIRCSEIASEDILGQSQGRSSYTWLAEYCIQFLAAMHNAFVCQLTLNFHERRH